MGEISFEDARNNEGLNKTIYRESLGFSVRNQFWQELQQEVTAIFQNESELKIPGLIKYDGIERIEQAVFLTRKNGPEKLGEYVFRDLDNIGWILLKTLLIMEEYHRRGLVFGGICRGHLKQDESNNFWLQDPPVMNHFSNGLSEIYHIVSPSEVIHGRQWDQASDIFSWGLLAYQLITECDPFQARNAGTRLQQIERGRFVSPKDVNPSFSQSLSNCISNCLNSNPEKRPKLAVLICQFSQLLNDRKLLVTKAEAAIYARKAEFHRWLFRLKQFCRDNSNYIFTVVGIIMILLIFPRLPGMYRAKVITPATKPIEVIRFYFEGLETLDTPLVQETLATKVANSFEGLISGVSILNKAQRAIPGLSKNNRTPKVVNLQIEQEVANSNFAKYKVSYTLELTLPDNFSSIQRTDSFVLKPNPKVWRIVSIIVLKEHKLNWNMN